MARERVASHRICRIWRVYKRTLLEQEYQHHIRNAAAVKIQVQYRAARVRRAIDLKNAERRFLSARASFLKSLEDVDDLDCEPVPDSPAPVVETPSILEETVEEPSLEEVAMDTIRRCLCRFVYICRDYRSRIEASREIILRGIQDYRIRRHSQQRASRIITRLFVRLCRQNIYDREKAACIAVQSVVRRRLAEKYVNHLREMAMSSMKPRKRRNLSHESVECSRREKKNLNPSEDVKLWEWSHELSRWIICQN